MKKHTFLITALFLALTIFSPLYYNSEVKNSTALQAKPVNIHTPPQVAPRQNTTQLTLHTGSSLYSFKAVELEKLLGLTSGSLNGIVITAADDNTTLTIGTSKVEVGQYIARSSIDNLTCQISGGLTSTSVEILPQSGATSTVPAMVNINISDENDYIKPVIKPYTVYTLQNINVAGALQVYNVDAEKQVSYILRSQPQKGVVEITNSSFTYSPFAGYSGDDSFSMCAVDNLGNCSDDVVFDVSIETSAGTVTFADMAASPYHYSAIKLKQNGIINGEQVGEQWFFHPQREVTNGEFIVMLLSALGEDKNLEAVTSTGLNLDSEIPMWLKPYVVKAIKLGIIKEKTFDVNDVPMRAEAVLLIDRALRKQNVQYFNLILNDLDDIPAWALSSYMKLGKQGMLSLYDGYAHPRQNLTRGYAAELVWQLYRNAN